MLAFLFIVNIQLQQTVADYEKPPRVLLGQFEENREIAVTYTEDMSIPELPEDLIILPGPYRVGNYAFNVTEGGRLLYFNPEAETRSRVVYDGNVYRLISAYAWLHAHGTKHDEMSPAQMDSTAKSQKLIATCTRSVNWIINSIAPLKISARLVQTMTLDRWNGYGDSHSMLEVWVPEDETWVLFDITNNYFFKLNSKPLNLLNFVEAVKRNDPALELKALASDAASAVGTAGAGFDYDLWWEARISTPSARLNWYKRYAQVALEQWNDGFWYFYDSANKPRIELFGGGLFYSIPLDEWKDRFNLPPPGGH